MEMNYLARAEGGASPHAEQYIHWPPDLDC